MQLLCVLQQEHFSIDDITLRLNKIRKVDYNETEKVQSLGRLRHDIDILVYRVTKNEDIDRYVNIPNRFFNVNLTAEDKNELSLILDLKNSNGRLLKWPSIKGLLEKQGYTINDSFQTLDGKRMRASKITITM